jgi:hypothetical protein
MIRVPQFRIRIIESVKRILKHHLLVRPRVRKFRYRRIEGLVVEKIQRVVESFEFFADRLLIDVRLTRALDFDYRRFPICHLEVRWDITDIQDPKIQKFF